MATLTATEAEANQLWREFGRTRDVRLRNVIVLRHLGLVRQLARRAAARTREPEEDLVQEGCLGLIRAVERFEPERGVRFSSYAFPVIEGALKNYLKRRRPLVPQVETEESSQSQFGRREREQPIDPALLEQLLEQPEEDFTLTVVDRLATERLLQRLSPLERKVIQHFFYADLTQREVARVVARSSSRVSRILRQALSALKAAALEDEAAAMEEAGLTIIDRETGLLSEQQLQRVLARERESQRGGSLAVFRFLRRTDPRSLRRFAEMASEQMRVTDEAFRLGREEVAILFRESPAGTRAACERLRSRERRAIAVKILRLEDAEAKLPRLLAAR